MNTPNAWYPRGVLVKRFRLVDLIQIPNKIFAYYNEKHGYTKNRLLSTSSADEAKLLVIDSRVSHLCFLIAIAVVVRGMFITITCSGTGIRRRAGGC